MKCLKCGRFFWLCKCGHEEKAGEHRCPKCNTVMAWMDMLKEPYWYCGWCGLEEKVRDCQKCVNFEPNLGCLYGVSSDESRCVYEEKVGDEKR